MSSPGWASQIFRHATSYGSGECVLGSPKFGSSLWLCTIEAPASTQARAAAMISSIDRGTLGLAFFVVDPLIAASMTNGVADPMAPSCTFKNEGCPRLVPTLP